VVFSPALLYLFFKDDKGRPLVLLHVPNHTSASLNFWGDLPVSRSVHYCTYISMPLLLMPAEILNLRQAEDDNFSVPGVRWLTVLQGNSSMARIRVALGHDWK
jgi:hypothetical protein